MSGQRIIIDTDPGIDDALAIALAVTAGFAIEGITVVYGNGGLENTSINAKVILRVLGAPDVPVYVGAEHPLKVFPDRHAQSMAGITVHGDDGLGGARPPLTDADKVFGKQSAAEFIYDACSKAKGEITVVCLGPLTNLAQSLRDHPDLVGCVRGVVVMGGAFGEKRGNRTPCAEANFDSDCVAAKEVLNAGFPNLVLAGLDVTHQCDLMPIRAALKESGGHVASFLNDVSFHYCSAYFQLGHSKVPVHDPTTIAYLMQPDMFVAKEATVECEVEGELTRGMACVDWSGQWKRKPNCKVLMSVDTARFQKLFLDSVRGYDEGRPGQPKRAKKSEDEFCDSKLPPKGVCKGPSSCCGPADAGLAVSAPVVRVGVGVIIVQESKPNCLLVGRRIGSHGAGLLQLPGGHLEFGEQWEDCALREVEEETGIKLEKVCLVGITNDQMPRDNKHYVTIFMAGACPSGTEAQLLEPHKCLGWEWAPWDKLPGPLFEPLEKLAKSGFKLPSPEALMKGTYVSSGFPKDCGYMS